LNVNLQVHRSNVSVVKFYTHIGFKDDEVVSLGKRLNELGPHFVATKHTLRAQVFDSTLMDTQSKKNGTETAQSEREVCAAFTNSPRKHIWIQIEGPNSVARTHKNI
jgi:hypothetical protein